MYLTLKGNSVSQTDQFDVSHDPIEPFRLYAHIKLHAEHPGEHEVARVQRTTTTTRTTRC
jgi:hypothetical protein